MELTVNIKKKIFCKASQLTGITDKSELVRMALVLLISRESARRLPKLGGSEPKLKGIVRRRMKS